MRSSQSNVHGAGSSTMRAPSRSHVCAASSSPRPTADAIVIPCVRSVSAIVVPASGRPPSRAVSCRFPRAAGGGVSGVTGAPPTAIPASSAAQSAIVRAIGPGWSSDGANGTMPSSGSRPWVGLIAHVPQQADGILNDPHVSLPSAAGVIRAASAAALPPLEPPAIRRSECGLPTWSVVPPAANSCVCACPSRTMPSLRSRAHTVLSPPATLPSSTRLDAVSGRSATPYRSLIPIGMPHSSGAASPATARRSSAARACVTASSGYRRAQALIASGAPSAVGAPPLR